MYICSYSKCKKKGDENLIKVFIWTCIVLLILVIAFIVFLTLAYKRGKKRMKQNDES
jgi:flagellar basal body-associated protein FliL